MSTKRMRRTGPSGMTPFGYVRHGLVHDVPADADLSGWEAVSEGTVERVTEPAPAKAAAKPKKGRKS